LRRRKQEHQQAETVPVVVPGKAPEWEGDPEPEPIIDVAALDPPEWIKQNIARLRSLYPVKPNADIYYELSEDERAGGPQPGDSAEEEVGESSEAPEPGGG
jgi:hypothetical protein